MIRKTVNFSVEVKGRSPIGEILKNKHRKGWVRTVPIQTPYEEKISSSIDKQKNILSNINEIDPLQERLELSKRKRKIIKD